MHILHDTHQCTACTTCKSICPVQAIIMVENEQGFLYPVIDESKCIECGKCKKVCPINSSPAVSSSSDYFAAMSKREDQRLHSTSGGVFSLLAEDVLNSKGVVFGAAYDEQQQVYHRCINSVNDISLLQGAKYVQSDLGDSFTKVKSELDNGRIVLFSGTPCQVAGLKKYLGKDYGNLLTVDLVCHGVPSPKAWNAYLEYRKINDEQSEIAKHINLRSKHTGWSNYAYSVVYQYSNGFEYENKNGVDSYMRAFVGNMILRPSCSQCHFKGVHRCSDFTLGDFWGIWDLHPEMDDNKGTSLVLIHTDKGREYWEAIKGSCNSLKVSEEETYQQNESLLYPSLAHSKREKLLESLSRDGFEGIQRTLPEIVPWKKPSMMGRVLGKMKRIVKK